MGYINQASAGASNSPRITISMWARVDSPIDTTAVSLVTFGGQNSKMGTNAIYLGQGDKIAVQFHGVIDGVTDLTDILTTTDQATDTDWQEATDPSVLWTPSFTATTAGSIGGVAPGNWFHLFVAADFTNTTSFGGTNNTCFVFINGARADFDTTPGTFLGRIVDNPTGQVQPQFCSNTTPGVAELQYFVGPFVYTRTIGGGSVTLTGNIPGFNIELNGAEIGIPAIASDVTSGANPIAAKHADVQIWIGTYIDPNANIDKFISAGKPVNPSIAEAAFGAPTYRFNRPASDITNNTGTGGAFTKTGTVTDATPGP